MCSEANSGIYAVESPEEIRAEWVQGLERVGVIGDNVIPDWMVADAVVRVKSLGAS